MRDPKLLVASAITKRFGGHVAVDDMSFAIGPGEILGLIGPNGAGKTTMFDLLAGSLRPTRGTITLAGRSVEGLAPHARAALGLGRTFQIPRPFPAMSVVENVMLGRKDQAGERIWPNWFAPQRVAREERDTHDRAMELLDFVALGRLARSPAGILSGGQRKLLELARVLMGEPEVMLLDEPAAGVNPTLLDHIVDRILAINRRGITLLVIEHNMDVVARLCRRVIVMAAGRRLAEGSPEAVTRNPAVVDAYLGGAPADDAAA